MVKSVPGMKGRAHAEPGRLQPPPLVAIPPRLKQTKSHSSGDDHPKKMLKMKVDPAMCMKTNVE